jgi:predicted amidophosphoribosyltransferase
VRFLERGFNQTELIAQNISKKFACGLALDIVKCKNTKDHRAGQSKKMRKLSSPNPFFIDNISQISGYKSITLLDDVITTGRTLENIMQVLQYTYPTVEEFNAICLFRGKPYYI